MRSEDVIVQAPMSFTGSTARIMRLRRYMRYCDSTNRWANVGWALADVGIVTGIIFALLTAWSLVFMWYAFFGLAVVPYRLVRRSQRNSKREALRHREMIDAINSRR